MTTEPIAEEAVAAPAVPATLEAIHGALDRLWAAAGPAGRVWQLEFATAVAEVAANVVRHAYPPGSASRPLGLRLRLYADRVEARFADRGVAPTLPGPAPASLPDDLDLLPESGYGLALARATVDRLSYRRTKRGVNVWRLVKRTPPGEQKDANRRAGGGRHRLDDSEV